MPGYRSRLLTWAVLLCTTAWVASAGTAAADVSSGANLALARAKVTAALQQTDRLASSVRAPASLTHARAQLASALSALSAESGTASPSRLDDLRTAAQSLTQARTDLTAASAAGLPPVPPLPVDVGHPECTLPTKPCSAQTDHPAALGAPLPYWDEFIFGYWTYGGNTYIAECGLENGADDPYQKPMTEAATTSHIRFYGSALCNRAYLMDLTTTLHIWDLNTYSGGVIAGPDYFQGITDSGTAIGDYDRTHGESEWIHSDMHITINRTAFPNAQWQDLPIGCTGNGTATAICSMHSIPFSYIPYPPDETPLIKAVQDLVNQAAQEVEALIANPWPTYEGEHCVSSVCNNLQPGTSQALIQRALNDAANAPQVTVPWDDVPAIDGEPFDSSDLQSDGDPVQTSPGATNAGASYVSDDVIDISPGTAMVPGVQYQQVSPDGSTVRAGEVIQVGHVKCLVRVFAQRLLGKKVKVTGHYDCVPDDEHPKATVIANPHQVGIQDFVVIDYRNFAAHRGRHFAGFHTLTGGVVGTRQPYYCVTFTADPGGAEASTCALGAYIT